MFSLFKKRVEHDSTHSLALPLHNRLGAKKVSRFWFFAFRSSNFCFRVFNSTNSLKSRYSYLTPRVKSTLTVLEKMSGTGKGKKREELDHASEDDTESHAPPKKTAKKDTEDDSGDIVFEVGSSKTPNSITRVFLLLLLKFRVL